MIHLNNPKSYKHNMTLHDNTCQKKLMRQKMKKILNQVIKNHNWYTFDDFDSDRFLSANLSLKEQLKKQIQQEKQWGIWTGFFGRWICLLDMSLSSRLKDDTNINKIWFLIAYFQHVICHGYSIVAVDFDRLIWIIEEYYVDLTQ